jgi:hypothetical protein
MNNIITFIREKIEYAVGMGGYIGMSATIQSSLEMHINSVVTGLISLFFGVVLIIATHFIKNYLTRNYPK